MTDVKSLGRRSKKASNDNQPGNILLNSQFQPQSYFINTTDVNSNTGNWSTSPPTSWTTTDGMMVTSNLAPNSITFNAANLLSGGN
jgi:hypothetical protein